MNKNNILSSILLISCTSIGGGMLALPCATANNGFILSITNFIICWIFMTISALFMLEVTLWFKKNINIMTMVNQILGYKWKLFVYIIYILLLYSVMSAYIFAYDKWIKKIFINYINPNIIQIICILFFVILNKIIIFNKKNSVDKLNFILSLCLLLTYLIMVILCIKYINKDSLMHFNTKDLSQSLPLIITSFGFCIIIPTIAIFLKKNKKKLVKVIIIGSIIPLIIYIIWQLIILGIFPTIGEYNILLLTNNQENFDIMFVYFLENILKISFISNIVLFFSIFAILTSLIGISISLCDFIYDAINLKVNFKNNAIVSFLIIIPPIVVALYFPVGFTKILNFSGILVAILLGLLPITMAWFGRYKLNIKSNFRLMGEKKIIIVTYLFYIYIIIYEIYKLL